jgi:hypothetical protein
MKILKYSDFITEGWNPVLRKEVSDFISANKRSLFPLYDKEKSDDENEELLFNLFLEYPELMRTKINLDKIRSVSPLTGIKNATPILQNIGGVRDFKSF